MSTDSGVRQRATRRERRQQITEAARKIITERGMGQLTTQAMAEEVGLSEAGIYRHFEDKEEILLLVLEDVERTLLQSVAEGQREASSAIEKLRVALRSRLSSAERRRGASFMVINEALRLNNHRLEARALVVVEKYLGEIRNILSAGQEEGTIRPDIDPDMASRLFLGIVQSSVTLWALNARSFPLMAGFEDMWELYRSAVDGTRRIVPEPSGKSREE